MVNSPLFVIFSVVINFALWLFFIRFLLQLAAIDKRHPYTKAVWRLSAVVDVFARIFPNVGQGRVSLSAIFLMLLVWLMDISGKAMLLGESLTALQLFFSGTITAIMAFLQGLKYTIIASIVCSFIVLFSQKIHPVIDIIMDLATPIIEPFRKISPNLGMIDLAPMIAFLMLTLSNEVLKIIASRIWQGIS